MAKKNHFKEFKICENPDNTNNVYIPKCEGLDILKQIFTDPNGNYRITFLKRSIPKTFQLTRENIGKEKEIPSNHISKNITPAHDAFWMVCDYLQRRFLNEKKTLNDEIIPVAIYLNGEKDTKTFQGVIGATLDENGKLKYIASLPATEKTREDGIQCE